MNYVDLKGILIDFFIENVTSDYMLLDLPYFSNIGDSMIWESTLDLLKDVKYKCVYSASSDTYQKKNNISTDTIILFMGGGNFGDIWTRHQDFRYRVMADYPENPIIQLPQSIFFDNLENIKKDSETFSKHKGPITICTRDERSYEITKKCYPFVKSVLLPDLVLSLNVNKYDFKLTNDKVNLFMKRHDCETNLNARFDSIPCDVDVRDWPTMEKLNFNFKIYYVLHECMKKLHTPKSIQNKFTDIVYSRILRHTYIKEGIHLLAQYQNIYTTRLHGAILGWLLGKNVYIIDNSYGKCSGVYDLWLNDQNKIKVIEK